MKKKNIEKYNEEIYKQDINLNIKNTKKKIKQVEIE